MRRLVHRIGFEQLGHVEPQFAQRLLDALARFVGAVAQPHDPVGRMLLVIARLLDRLAGDAGQFGVARFAQPLPQQLHQRRDHRVAQHGEGEVAARQLDQREVAVVALVAQEGELVFVVPVAFELARMREHGAGLADQVERHVGHARCLPRAWAHGRTTRRCAGRGSGRCRRCAAGTARRAVVDGDGTLHHVPHMWSTEPGSR